MAGMKYKEIAEKYGVTLNTVKSWKTRYKWSKDGKKGAHTKPEKSMHTKRGAQPGNKNSSGGPPGNKKQKNTVSSRSIFRKRPFLLSRKCPRIRLTSCGIRSRSHMLPSSGRRKLCMLSDQEDKTIDTDRRKKTDNVCGERWEVQQAWDKHGELPSRLRQGRRRRWTSMINKYDDLLHKNWELATEEQRARIERIKARYRKNQGR